LSSSQTRFKGVEYYSSFLYEDKRGKFEKFFSQEWTDLTEVAAKEIFVSESKVGTIRGMHLQVRENANARIISVLEGSVFDVVIDLRSESPTYKQVYSKILSPRTLSTVLVPKGVAHGFQALENSKMLYISSATYDPINDVGVNPISISVNWPLSDYILSDRDEHLPPVSLWADPI